MLLGEEASDALIASGYGGLQLRGWARGAGEQLELDPAIRGIADVLGTADKWIQVGFLGEAEAASVLIIGSPSLAMVVRPVETGVLDVAALEPGVDPESVAGNFASGFLSGDSPGTVTIEVESDKATRAAAAQSSNGSWSFLTTADGDTDNSSPGEGMTADQVAAKFVGWLTATLAPVSNL